MEPHSGNKYSIEPSNDSYSLIDQNNQILNTSINNNENEQIRINNEKIATFYEENLLTEDKILKLASLNLELDLNQIKAELNNLKAKNDLEYYNNYLQEMERKLNKLSTNNINELFQQKVFESIINYKDDNKYPTTIKYHNDLEEVIEKTKNTQNPNNERNKITGVYFNNTGSKINDKNYTNEILKSQLKENPEDVMSFATYNIN